MIMKWILIKKDKKKNIKNYKARGVKEYLQKESSYQCVYCALKDNVLGGIDHYHVEHYKPKGDSRFKHLINEYRNLFYSCPICNRFKGNDWPANPVKNHSKPAYPNPSVVDYNDIFDVDIETGEIKGNYSASKYMEERLYLNRPHLLLERKRAFLNKICKDLVSNFDKLSNELATIKNQEAVKLLEDLGRKSTNLTKLFLQLEEIPSYESNDIRRS